MTIRTREAAAKAAEAVTRYDVGMCQVFTRTMFGAPAVGDRDHDGDADAVDGWLSEPVSARHAGDRNPPRGVPVAFSGGSRGYGHRAVSLGGGKIRSTDMGSLGKYAPGLVSTVTIAHIEAAMGVKYTGWTETISGQVIPGAVKPPAPTPDPPANHIPGMAFACHNIYVGNKAPAKNIAKMLKATGLPLAAPLQEASNFHAETVEVGKTKYRAYRASDDPTPDVQADVSDRDLLTSIVLVRDDVTVRRVEARQVPDGAWSWNDNKRVARIWVRVVCEYKGHVFEVWSIHRCPGGPQPGIVGNRAAWAAEHRFLVEWIGRVLKNHPGRHLEPGGDWNSWPGKMPNHPYSIEALGRDLDAEVNLRHIDGFLSINAPKPSGRPKHGKTQVKKLARKFGSDGHRPVVVTLP